jgi:hypothetical protein
MTMTSTENAAGFLAWIAAFAAVLAALVALVGVRWQIRAAAREAWIREFREQLAKYFALGLKVSAFQTQGEVGAASTDVDFLRQQISHAVALQDKSTETMIEMYVCLNQIELMLAERRNDELSTQFLRSLGPVTKGDFHEHHNRHAIHKQAVEIMRRERTGLGRSGLWFVVSTWRPWVQLKEWAKGRPRFRT